MIHHARQIFVCVLVLGIAMAMAPTETFAEDPLYVHSFERHQLSDEFYGEGAHHGDFNRDGNGDVVSGPYWYAGPDFTERHEIYPPVAFNKNGYSDNFLCWGDDVDGDGWDDVVVGGFPGREGRWHENPGKAKGPWKRHDVVQGLDNESPHYVDITGDGKKEFVFHLKGRWGWASPDGKDARKPWKFHAISPDVGYQRFTHGMGVGDVDGDGLLDILEAKGWWKNSGKPDVIWTRQDVNFAPNGGGGAQMFAYDFDGDGDSDVIASPQAHGHGLYWFEQKREGAKIQFEAHVIIDPRMGTSPRANKYGVNFSQPHAMDLVDMDRDGIMDIVTGKRYWAHNGHDPDARGNVVSYWFKTTRTDRGVDFVPFYIDGVSGVGTQVIAGDLDGDGWPDVIVGNKSGTYALMHKVRAVDKKEYEASFPRATGETVSANPQSARPDPGTLPKVAGHEIDLGFESGNLKNWTAKGEAFAKMPIRGDAALRKRRNQRAKQTGDFWAGSYELAGDAPQGTLTSIAFPVTHPYGSFLIGGGHFAQVRVEIVRKDSGKVILKSSGTDQEPMRRAVIDLRAHHGKEIFVRLVDHHSGPWGHINYDDFRFHAARPHFAQEAHALTPDAYPFAGQTGEEAAKNMAMPFGFRATLFAGEPDVKQPIAFTLDDRGRVWVAEAYSYPIRRKDSEARDRILIFEDKDGDGHFDERKVFAEGLNLVSGLEVGHGGVWVGAAPYLLFIPDRNGDDRPDSKPQVLLDGWGMQDTHETLNSFIWGPDGWLYGCHGVFTHSFVGKPGAPDSERQRINAGIWRYHPTRHEFDVYCRGTSNPWGVDWNDRGQAFLTACVIPHLYQVIQGARYTRQGGRHFNPNVYDDIKTIADHRHYLGANPHRGNNKSDSAGGGHAHCGAMIYLGGTWPGNYRDQIFMNNIHGQRVNMDVLKVKGSGYVAHHGADFLLTHDRWSQGLNLRYGPDGQVYLIDWYDANACHHGKVDGHDRSNGRIYKISYGDQRATQVALRDASDDELAAHQLNANDWYVRHSRRILAERAGERKLTSSSIATLRQIATGHTREERRLRGLWSLHVTANLTEDIAQKALRDYSPYVRGWAIELIMEDGNYSEASYLRFVEMAKKDRSPVVRLYLSSALQRIAHDRRWNIIEPLLAHGSDATDHNLPLMYWYAIEPLAEVDPARALKIASRGKIPLIHGYMVRRLAGIDSASILALLVEDLGRAKTSETKNLLLGGIQTALRGKRIVPMPATWPAVYERLATSEDQGVKSRVEALAVTFGDPRALAGLRQVLAQAGGDTQQRLSALEALVAAKDARVAPILQSILSEPAMRAASLRALAAFSDPYTPSAVLTHYAALNSAEKRDALNTLSSRASYGRALLLAVGKQQVSPRDLSADIVRQLRNLKHSKIDELLAEVWGRVSEPDQDVAAKIQKYKKLIEAKSGRAADPVAGRALFVKTCAQCHALFGKGGAIGPDLTGSNRSDLDYLLSNVLAPSAVMANEYRPHVFVTTDGRVLTGLLKEENKNAYTIQTTNEVVILPRSEVAQKEQAESSMMPEDLLVALTNDAVRDLVAYLRSPSQTRLLATAENAADFFNGRNLDGWAGNPKLWSVEDGEIIGRSPGLRRNEWLRSEMLVGDFRLRLKVKLTPDGGNSGIQFRSQEIERGEVKGYQADIGVGWWGKLYEEHGRALLWDRPGDQHVKKGEWNDYEIVAIGSRIRTYINGKLCVDLNDPKGARSGIIAPQIHSGPAMEVRFKDIRLEVDPKPRDH